MKLARALNEAVTFPARLNQSPRVRNGHQVFHDSVSATRAEAGSKAAWTRRLAKLNLKDFSSFDSHGWGNPGEASVCALQFSQSDNRRQSLQSASTRSSHKAGTDSSNKSLRTTKPSIQPHAKVLSQTKSETPHHARTYDHTPPVSNTSFAVGLGSPARVAIELLMVLPWQG